MTPALVVAARLLIILLFSFALAGSQLRAQPGTVDSGAGGTTSVDVEPSTDPWQFEDEKEAETWRTLLGDQAADLVLFAAFASLALVSFFRKSVRLKYVTLAAAVVYMGFAKSQLISVVNVYSLITWSLPVFKYSLAWYLFAVFTVISTVLWGRLYCGRICAYGALTQLLDRIVPARLRLELPPQIERRAASVKYVLLGGTILYFLATSDISVYRYVEPFWMFTRRATTGLWIALGVLLLATVFVRNLYCRFLCPVGAALGLLSTLTVFRIKRWSECNTCKICEKACEWGAIRGPKILMTECVRCDDCERLYADTQTCPHWIIIRKKSEIMARQSAAPAESGDFLVPMR
jgi:polyferredoxin